jgi:hypothetical protein
MREVLGPIPRLLQKLSLGCLPRILSPLQTPARQLQGESTSRLTPLPNEHHVALVRQRYNRRETCALEDTVIDLRPVREPYLVDPKGAPWAPVQILRPERPPSPTIYRISHEKEL